MDVSPAVRERAYVQVQAHNVSVRPVAIEDVDVVSDAWDVALLDAPDAASTAQHLHPKDVRQWLLALTPRDPAALEAATLEQLSADMSDVVTSVETDFRASRE